MRQHGIFTPGRRALLPARLRAPAGAGSAIGWASSCKPRRGGGAGGDLFLIGLNLMGAFEVGQLAPSSLLSMQAKHPGVDAFSRCWR